jgi:hypothetical protein
MADAAKGHLVLLWSSRDADVASKMVMPYARNSRAQGWWEAVTLIIWGPSVKTLCGDAALITELKDLMDAGVMVESCQACDENYGLAEKMRSLGIDQKYMGQPLSAHIRSGANILTF